jgi:hypothetical protein
MILQLFGETNLELRSTRYEPQKQTKVSLSWPTRRLTVPWPRPLPQAPAPAEERLAHPARQGGTPAPQAAAYCERQPIIKSTSK